MAERAAALLERDRGAHRQLSTTRLVARWGRPPDGRGELLGLFTRGWRRRDWIWTRAGEELATVRLSQSLGETKARVRLTPAGRARGMGVLLLLVGCNIGLLAADDSASAGCGDARIAPIRVRGGVSCAPWAPRRPSSRSPGGRAPRRSTASPAT